MTENLFSRHEELATMREEILMAAQRITDTYRAGGKLLLCGNGGSCADCDHIAGELMKGFLLKRPLPESLLEKFQADFGAAGLSVGESLQQGLPAISLAAHPALLTAFSNDVNPELIYAQQVLGYGHPGDLVIVISTSGNAGNVAAALMTAKALGIATLGLTGRGGGKMAGLCDLCLKAPASETYRVQEYHIVLYHFLCAYTESEMFDE